MLKPLNLIIVLSLLSSPLCIGQNQLVGKWSNSYGSTLAISSQSQGKVEGVYSSSTGSTGKYKIIGTYSPVSAKGNLSVTLTILWNSIDGTTKDPSQFWTSAMVGVYYSEKNVMELINQISAAEKFEAVNVLEPGVYPESLTFTKEKYAINTPKPMHTYIMAPPLRLKNQDSWASTKVLFSPMLLNSPQIELSPYYALKSNTINNTWPTRKNNAIATKKYNERQYETKTIIILKNNWADHEKNAINGTWVNREKNAACSQITISVTEKNEISAIITVNGKTISAFGLAANPGKSFQSVSIASLSLPTENNKVLGFTGLLNLTKDQLKLVISTSTNVAYKDKYAATNVNVFYFTRASL